MVFYYILLHYECWGCLLIPFTASVYTVSSPKQQTNESEGMAGPSSSEPENRDLESNNQPTTQLDLTDTSVEMNNNKSNEDSAVEVPRVDSQGNLSPKQKEVFVDIAVSFFICLFLLPPYL